MQINLYIYENYFNDELRERIDKVIDLNKYMNILPKSIQINTIGHSDISIIE